MKKNLFLTLALAFATLAGVNAQDDWSATISKADGLPGEKTEISGRRMYTYTSEKITPAEALQKLRVTFSETEGGDKFVCLSEFKVFAADGVTPIAYTVTSNADHNSLNETKDGQGLDALKDGIYTNYWHSDWGGKVEEPHHIVLTFSEPVEEFILSWTSRPHNPENGNDFYHNAPTLVGLTPADDEFVPYADWAFELGEQITTMDELLEAPYFVMQSSVPEEWHAYKNNNDTDESGLKFGDRTTKDDKPMKGEGPKFVNAGEIAAEASPSYVIQLIETEDEEGETAYYLYFVTSGRYLSKHPTHNAWNGANGTQGTTAVLSNAALVYIKECEDGDVTSDGHMITEEGRFEMYYKMEYNDEEVEIHMGATPANGGFKNVDLERYEYYMEGNDYCLGYAYIIKFDWNLYNVSMNYPDKYLTLPIKGALKEAYSIQEFMNDEAVEGRAQYYNEFKAAIEDAEESLENGSYETISEVFEDIQTLNEAMALYVWSKVDWYNKVEFPRYIKEYGGDNLCSANAPVDGKYTQEAWNEYMVALQTEISALANVPDGEEYENLTAMQDLLNSIQSKVDAFLASKIEFITLPKIYSSSDILTKPLGAQNGDRYDWEQLITLKQNSEGVNGFRITFLKTAGNPMANGYPMVAISGLEVIVDGEELPITAADITTNSLELKEGSIENLLDDNGATFYHSIYSDGKFEPVGYVYLDVKFPQGVKANTFTIRMEGRQGQPGFRGSPSKVSIGEYGEVYDPLIGRANPYNVAGGTQITDVEQLVDGGLYIISGNLRAKTKNSAPRYYSGAAPYHTNIMAALNDPCVYMFKKTEKGWNIISLAKAQFWALNKEENKDEETGNVSVDYSTGLTLDPEKAAEVNFVPSGNLENTFVIYSDLGEHNIEASWEWTNPNDETDVINIAAETVNANKFVFMDWDGSLAGRPCVNELPGVFQYGLDVIDAHQLAEEIKDGDTGYSAGDYLHFNKSNGEGEWNIYAVTMNTPYCFWAKSIVESLEGWGLATGNDPGSLAGEIAEYEAAVDDLEAAIAEENEENADEAIEDFYASYYLTEEAERVGVQNNYWYAIQSAYPEYYNQQGKIKAIYAKEDGLYWKDAPAAYSKDDDTDAFVFQFEKYGDEFLFDPDNLGITEDESEFAFRIRSGKYNAYAGKGGGTEIVVLTTKNNAPVYIVKPLERNVYTIYTKGSNPLHTAGHGEGAGNDGKIVNWGGDAYSTSSWVLRFVDDADETNSIADLVVEGDEVVSVAYFTPAGAAIPAPVSGINIVVTIYSNGVIETKKVLVK